ncbi:MAG: MFS transporter [Actinomycetota bacterium]
MTPSSRSSERMQDAVNATQPSGRIDSFFGSWAFFKLWIAQVISATGDWLGLIAIISLAGRISEESEGTAIALVLGARIAPGFFLATAAGVIVDRLDRKQVMVFCDIGRALVMFALPWVDSLAGLIIASFILEILTMLWSPAKEAVVPNLVPKEKLTTANSLNVAAAYGMFPVAAGIAALLAKLSSGFADEGWVDTWHFNEEGLAFYVNGISFIATALIIWNIHWIRRTREERRSGERGSWDLGGAVRELREGWRYIAVNPIVRAVNIGLATGVIGGGMLVPLGAIFVDEVISGEGADFNLVLFALGTGMAGGVVMASVFQNRINRSRVFPFALLVAGGALLVAASGSVLSIVVPAIAVVGFAAGPIYVLGFTLLHENVDDELRGRIFASLLVLVRFCVLLALAIAPALSEVLDGVSNSLWDRDISFGDLSIFVPGVRLTMWLSAIIIMLAGLLAMMSLRAGSGAFVSGAAFVDDEPADRDRPGNESRS